MKPTKEVPKTPPRQEQLLEEIRDALRAQSKGMTTAAPSPDRSS